MYIFVNIQKSLKEKKCQKEEMVYFIKHNRREKGVKDDPKVTLMKLGNKIKVEISVWQGVLFGGIV